MICPPAGEDDDGDYDEDCRTVSQSGRASDAGRLRLSSGDKEEDKMVY